MRIQLIPMVFVAVALAACGTQLNSGGGDDDFGEPVDNTPDDYNAPEWVNAHELLVDVEPYLADQPSAINNTIVDPELAATPPIEREYAAFAPFTPPQPDHQTGKCVYCGWPSKPFMKGLPEFPYATWQNAGGAYQPFDASADDFGHQQGDLRTGLIGNFTIHTPTLQDGVTVDFCGDQHPRAPICTPLVAQIGHPFIAGRYNDYGLACSLQDTYAHLPGEECSRHYILGVNQVAPGYPIAMGIGEPGLGDDTPYDGANSLCIAMGETYRPEIGVLTAGQRGGSTYLNIREFGDLVSFVQVTLSPVTELLEAIPWWDYTNEQWDYVTDLDEAAWRWSEWSTTGECGFKAGIRYLFNAGDNTCVGRTWSACPVTHFAVLPPFLGEGDGEGLKWECEASGVNQEVTGFCGLPFFDWTPGNENASGSIKKMDISTGYHRGYQLDFSKMDSALLTDWGNALALTPTEDGLRVELPVLRPNDPESVRLHAIGEDLLAMFDLQSGDRIVSIDSDIDLRHDDLDILGTLYILEGRWSGARPRAGVIGPQVVSFMVERDDGWVLPTYTFPVFVPTSETPEDTTSDSSDSTGTTSEG